MKNKKITMITGASSGIGYATAEIFAEHGYDLILLARRQDRLEEIASQFRDAYTTDTLILPFDIRNKNVIDKLTGILQEKWKNIDVLVNNAGLALGLENIDEGNPDDWETMIDTNVKGLLYVSKAITPLMKARGQGKIINIGSIAGSEVYPKGNVYCATKFAVDALTQAMRVDLLETGIGVTHVAPGATETEFSYVRFKGNDNKADAVYQGFTPLTGRDVAEVILFCAERSTHVNINDVLIMPKAQAKAGMIYRK